MPPMMVWSDIRGWLATEQQIDPDRSVRLAADAEGAQLVAFGVGAVAFAGAAVGVYSLADTSEDRSQEFTYGAVPLPTTTTTTSTSTTTTTTTTIPPTTVPGETTPPTSEATGTTAPAGPEVDPSQFPDEAPPGVISPVLFTLLTGQGVPGNQAHCAIVTAYSIVDEQTLLAMGVAEGNPEALDVLREGSRMCGIPEEQVEAAIAEQFG
jgi:hypothetical protein